MRKLLSKIRSFLLAPVLGQKSQFGQTANVDKGTQILISLKLKEMLQSGLSLPSFDDIGFGVFSDNDEDGILLYIFTLIGVTNKNVVDIGAGSVRGSNTANLIINHGWIGLLIDGSERAIKAGRKFYSNCPDTRQFPPTSVCVRVTTENVNSIITEHGFTGEIDLLAIDIDGIDYWIWKAIDCISPRVIVLEYQDIIGPVKALTVPYNPDFNASDYKANQRYANYVGASLPALAKLAEQRGYRLVGCNRYGYNAFFVRSGIGEEHLPAVQVDACLQHPWNKFGMENRFPTVKDMDWVEV